MLTDDAAASELNLPDNMRWSFGGRTQCGEYCYLRPCQTLAGITNERSGCYPLVELCRPDGEAIFIVDDDLDLREEIAEQVRSLGYHAVLCANAAEFQAEVPHYQSGCVLLDIKLPGIDGVGLQEWLRHTGVMLPVVFISGVADLATAVYCMKAGAVEFIQKPATEMVLRRAINSAVTISRKRFCRMKSEEMVRGLLDKLTPTELVVAKMIAQGYPTKLIASELGRSENTIKIHRHRILQKLMVNSVASVANLLRHVGM